MGNIKRKLIIISLVPFLVIVIGLAAVIYFNSSMITSKEPPLQKLKTENINKVTIGEYISSNHDYWNEELCWGRSKSFSFVVFQKHYSEYIEYLNEIINASQDTDLRADFIYVHDLLENAYETKDINFLINIHRVFHDLDIKYNGYKTGDYYGITQYGENP